MMVRHLILCGLMLFLIVRGSAQVYWPAIEDLAQNYVKKSKNRGLVLGIIKGNEQSVRGFGQLSRTDQRMPDGQTIFEIGAVTTVFTTSAVMIESQKGKFVLEGSIQPFLTVDAPVFRSMRCLEITLPNRERLRTCTPDPLARDQCVSFCDLASHTSGLACSCKISSFAWNPFVEVKFEDEFYDETKEALYLSLPDFQLKSPPGEVFRYSNVGMALLGHVVADAAGKSYEALLIDNLLAPLGLTDTRLAPDAAQRQRLAPGHNYRGRSVAPWSFHAMAPAAGLKSSASDLLRFLAANLNSGDTALDAILEQTQQSRVDVSFPGWHRHTTAAYGWLVSLLSEESNLPITWINGGTAGYRAFIGFSKDSQIALVALANSAQAVDELAWEILAILNQR